MIIGQPQDEKKSNRELLKEELAKLDHACVEVDGVELRPSQCYHIETDPLHVLFNENCPESLKEKIERLLKAYSV